MLAKTFVQNKRTYIAYNAFRKKIFSQLSPKESEAILYLLPWLLSVNHHFVPGYIKDLEKPFQVYGIERDRDIYKREAVFKNMFRVRKEGTFLRFPGRVNVIEGIYTIGSVGTISQTSRSDCDVWICFNHERFDEKAFHQFNQKINLIKDWFDSNLKMPLFFFISDIQDIRTCNYGNIGYESSGSAQKNILKEEFYRTTIMIGGKIPLWWVCQEEERPVDYNEFVEAYNRDTFGDYDFIDLGNLETVDRGEYFGAALWQFTKSLTHPLKSIIKMLLLEMLLVSPREELLCHQFRRLILRQPFRNPVFIDPSMFTMEAILKYNEDIDQGTFDFIKKCFYLRYEIKLLSKKLTLKETMAKDIFKKYPLDRKEIYRLNDFTKWPLHEQTEFGDQVLSLLLNIYKGITTLQRGITQGISDQDLTIIGRKLSSCLEKKTSKIPIIHKPVETNNLPMLTFDFDGKKWQVYISKDPSKIVVESVNIVYCLSYLVWNDIYVSGQIRMRPNPTSVTIQEIISLAKKIRDVFGAYDITAIDFDNFLRTERMTRMLVVVSFEGDYDNRDINDLCVLFKNNWGELFVRRFNSVNHLRLFLENNQDLFIHVALNYYIQRSNQYYEKTIERTKRIISQAILDNHGILI